MSYTQYNLSRLFAEIRDLIGDPSGAYWLDAEVLTAIQEGMREYSLVSLYWRATQQFTVNPPYSTQPPVRFYDLSILMPNLRPRTVTYDALLREMQALLYEPQVGFTGTGMTQQFNITQLRDALVRARNRFILDCALPLSYNDATEAIESDGFVDLPEGTIYVARAALYSADYRRYTPLERTDEVSMARTAYTGTAPLNFSQVTTRPNEMVLLPPPQQPSGLELLIATSTALNGDDIDANTLLGLPNDVAHAVKYAALSDILSMDGEGSNPFLSNYCEQRYLNIVGMARDLNAALLVKVDGTPVPMGALASLDRMYPNWGAKMGKPSMASCTYDLLTTYPLTDRQRSLTVSVVQAAPVPLIATDFIQMGPEEISALIDFCQHYLSIKLSGKELRDTFGQYDSFMRQGSQHMGLNARQITYLSTLTGQSRANEAMRPYQPNPKPTPSTANTGE